MLIQILYLIVHKLLTSGKMYFRPNNIWSWTDSGKFVRFVFPDFWVVVFLVSDMKNVFLGSRSRKKNLMMNSGGRIFGLYFFSLVGSSLQGQTVYPIRQSFLRCARFVNLLLTFIQVHHERLSELVSANVINPSLKVKNKIRYPCDKLRLVVWLGIYQKPKITIWGSKNVIRMQYFLASFCKFEVIWPTF